MTTVVSFGPQPYSITNICMDDTSFMTTICKDYASIMKKHITINLKSILPREDSTIDYGYIAWEISKVIIVIIVQWFVFLVYNQDTPVSNSTAFKAAN